MFIFWICYLQPTAISITLTSCHPALRSTLPLSRALFEEDKQSEVQIQIQVIIWDPLELSTCRLPGHLGQWFWTEWSRFKFLKLFLYCGEVSGRIIFRISVIKESYFIGWAGLSCFVGQARLRCFGGWAGLGFFVGREGLGCFVSQAWFVSWGPDDSHCFRFGIPSLGLMLALLVVAMRREGFTIKQDEGGGGLLPYTHGELTRWHQHSHWFLAGSAVYLVNFGSTGSTC